jgi:hypothetical protein
VPAVRSNREPDLRNGWSLLGFLSDCINSKAKFRRLVVLVVLLMVFVLLIVLACLAAKGDVSAWYDHVTTNAPAGLKYGSPPGAITLVFVSIKYFSHRKAVRKKRQEEARRAAALEAKKAAKKGNKAAKKKGLTGNRGAAKPNSKKPAD